MQDIILKSHNNMKTLDLPHPPTSIDFNCTNFQPEELHVQVIDAGISDHIRQLCNIK